MDSAVATTGDPIQRTNDRTAVRHHPINLSTPSACPVPDRRAAAVRSSVDVSFPSSVLTYQAAAEGVGVAVGQLFLLRNEIEDGTLVPLFNSPFKRPLAYYVA